jgi:hypothetical protein
MKMMTEVTTLILLDAWATTIAGFVIVTPGCPIVMGGTGLVIVLVTLGVGGIVDVSTGGTPVVPGGIKTPPLNGSFCMMMPAPKLTTPNINKTTTIVATPQKGFSGLIRKMPSIFRAQVRSPALWAGQGAAVAVATAVCHQSSGGTAASASQRK